MPLDTQLITQAQQLASQHDAHRVRSLLACYMGFASLLETHPEIRERAAAVEQRLRAFCATGRLSPTAVAN